MADAYRPTANVPRDRYDWRHEPSDSASDFAAALERARDGERLSVDDATELLATGTDVAGIDAERKRAVLEAADERRREQVGDDVTFVANLNNNVTTACTVGCLFCNFKDPAATFETDGGEAATADAASRAADVTDGTEGAGDDAAGGTAGADDAGGGFTKTVDESRAIVADAVDRGVYEVCSVSGLHPALGLDGAHRDAPAVADRYPAGTFFALTLAVSWTLWIPPLAALGSSPLRTLAILPGAFGPAVAAAVVTELRGESVRAWLRDAFAWRRPIRWYGIAVGLPVGVSAAVLVALVAVTGRFDESLVGPALVGFAVNVAFASLLGGGQEEFGWRGFALPHLQARYDALTASLIVGVVWALWHAPLFAFDASGYGSLSPPLYAVLVVGFAVVFTWFYNGSRGCLPAAIVLHGTVNAAVNVAPVLVGGPEALPVPLAGVLAVAFWTVALALVARYGRATLANDGAVLPTWTNGVENPAARRGTAGGQTDASD